MKLTHNIVQPFIRALEETLPYQVTITDVDGIIVGSSNPERLNQFHPSAYEIICGRQAIEILENDRYTNIPDGVILGYGEKIMYRGECIGLIGLIGPPEERKKDIKTAQFILRLLLDRERVQQELDLTIADKNAFIVKLLHGVSEKQERWAQERAGLYGIDLKCPRQILVIRIKLQKYAEEQPMALSRIKQEIGAMVSAVFSDPADLIYETETGEIAILAAMKQAPKHGQPERIRSCTKDLIRRIQEQYDMTVMVGISQSCDRYQDFGEGYRNAIMALEMGERTEPDAQIYCYEHMRLRRIVAGFPKETRQLLEQAILTPLRTAPGSDELLKTLQVYFEENLRVSSTAERLFLHRNTLQYRFKRIKEVTGYDISVTDEMIQLRLAVLQHQYFVDSDHPH